MSLISTVKQRYRAIKALTPEILADQLTKGRFSAFKAVYDASGGRVSTIEHRIREAGVQIPPVRSYSFLRGIEKTVSIVRTVGLKLKQEIFRNGGGWQPRFDSRCANCGEEFQEALEECPSCHNEEFQQPSTGGKSDFDSVIKTANFNGQTLLEVFGEIEEDLNIGDDAYLVTPKRILADSGDDGILLWPVEVFRGDPDIFRKVTDRKGLPGGMYWKCLRCGEIMEETDREKAQQLRCPNDGFIPYEVFFVATDYQGTEPKYYYIEGEVMHLSKYSPTLLYGFSPIITLFDEAMTLRHMDRRIRKRFETGRVEGILIIPTRNIETLDKAKDKMANAIEDNPNYFGILGVDPDAKQAPQFIQLLGTLGDNQALELKQELKERIGGLYGVSLVFQSDTSTSGGLNNEGIQITVTNRAVEKGQASYNDKLLPWLMKQYGVTDWIWKLNPNEEQDMVADEDLKAKRIQNATAMLQLGYTSKLLPNGEFKPEHDPEGAQELLSGGAILQPPISLGDESGGQRFTGEPSDLRRSDSNVRENMAKFITPRRVAILEALDEGALFDAFKGMSPANIKSIRAVMLESMSQPQGWSINSVLKNLKKVLPDAVQGNLRAIVRTETTSIQNIGRKLEYEERDPEGEFKFQWIGPNDRRTTDTCKAITRRSSKGVSLGELQKIINEEAKKEGFDARPMLPHFQCRHTLRRKVR